VQSVSKKLSVMTSMHMYARYMLVHLLVQAKQVLVQILEFYMQGAGMQMRESESRGRESGKG